MAKITWIKEKEACEMLGYKYCRTLRERVKNSTLPIRATNTFGRNWQYSQEDIQRHLLNASFNHQPQYVN